MCCVTHCIGNDRGARATSVPPLQPLSPRATSVPPLSRGARATSLSPLDSFLSEYNPPNDLFGGAIAQSPTPVKGRWGPRESEMGFDSNGNYFSKKNKKIFFEF